ncbi:MAG: biosynthetic-type acetolactate synthase large subunit [bacterium]|nr:biosynthetic-type acetolactate synthase large subunit [bacterium]
MRKGTEIILEAIKRQGIKEVFGYPGGCVIPLFDEFLNQRDIQLIRVCHEQAAAHAADGFARASGKCSVVIVTSGPGATNTITGIATAAMDSIPMVVITGQVRTPIIGTDAFQETNVIGVTRPVTKHNYLVKSVDELPEVLAEAFFIATTGRPGPVVVDIPVDIQTHLSDAQFPDQVTIPGYDLPQTIESYRIEAAWEMISHASRPVIYAGGGLNLAHAGAELVAFAEKARIPITTTLLGQGAVPRAHELALGMLGMHGEYSANLAMNRADLVLALGTRFDDRVTGKVETFLDKAKIIHVDVDPSVINKIKEVDLGIVGDVKDALTQLTALAAPVESEAWLKELKTAQAEHPLPNYDADETSDGKLRPEYVIKQFSELTGGDAVVVSDVGQHQMFTALHFAFKHPRTHLTSGGLGTMGFCLPAAIGAAFTRPEWPVISLSGDGGFQMNIQELATVKAYNLPILVVVLNNHNLGMVKQWQDLFWDERHSGTIFDQSPDFLKIAEGYGLKGRQVGEKSQVGPAILEGLAALKAGNPFFLEFMLDKDAMVYPMIPAGKEFKDLIEGGMP